MRTLRLRSRLLRATSAGICLALATAPAGAQLRPGAADRVKELNQPAPAPNNAQTNANANPAGQVAAPVAPVQRVIQHIVVRGYQRVEPDTVLTYVGLREGDNYTPADADTALSTLKSA